MLKIYGWKFVTAYGTPGIFFSFLFFFIRKIFIIVKLVEARTEPALNLSSTSLGFEAIDRFVQLADMLNLLKKILSSVYQARGANGFFIFYVLTIGGENSKQYHLSV